MRFVVNPWVDNKSDKNQRRKPRSRDSKLSRMLLRYQIFTGIVTKDRINPSQASDDPNSYYQITKRSVLVSRKALA